MHRGGVRVGHLVRRCGPKAALTVVSSPLSQTLKNQKRREKIQSSIAVSIKYRILKEKQKRNSALKSKWSLPHSPSPPILCTGLFSFCCRWSLLLHLLILISSGQGRLSSQNVLPEFDEEDSLVSLPISDRHVMGSHPSRL